LRSQNMLGPAAGSGDTASIWAARIERTQMKLSGAVIVISSTVLVLYSSSGFSQQRAGSSAVTTNTSSRQTQPFQPFLPPPTATTRNIGSPTVQPSSGVRVKSTPVEQEIAGFIIGPTDLCGR